MADFLGTMGDASANRVREARTRETFAQLRRRAAGIAPPPPLLHHESRFDLIPEIKLSAPSAGAFFAGTTPSLDAIASRAASYAEAGAAAVSVLTEPTVFSGQLEHLVAASRACHVPTLRKDFLVDPYQIFEARAAGAGGVLLILRMLDDSRLGEMIDAAGETGLFVLLEAFDPADLTRAAAFIERAGTRVDHPRLLVGLNCRDLATLAVDPSRFALPPSAFPMGSIRVAESGLETPSDMARIASFGYDMALVGGAVMRHADPRAALRALIEAGRAARRAEGGFRCA